jgi:hypothetical protein
MTIKIKTENQPRFAASSTVNDSIVADVVSSTPVVKKESATVSPSAVGVARRQNPIVTPSATLARAVVKNEEPSNDPKEDAVKQNDIATPDKTASSAVARAVSVVKQENVASSLAVVQTRKRGAASSVSTGSALGGIQRKRQKTERDFHLRTMEEKLEHACNYAKKGNRDMMDYVLGEARKHAEEAGASNAAFHARVSKIRCSLKPERDFHLRTMEEKLERACKYAKEGNRDMMDYVLGEARKHAEEAGASNAAFHTRVSKIRCSLCTGVVKTESSPYTGVVKTERALLH